MVNSIENELIILTKQTLDVMLKCKNPSDVISLYVFYYYTAKWQETNKIRCTTSYVAKAMNWGEDKVRKAKKELVNMKLVEDDQHRNDSNKIEGHYIKLNYVFANSTASKVPPSQFSTVWNNPQYGKSHTMENSDTNALSDNSLNALSDNTEMLKEKRNIKENSVFYEFANGDDKLLEALNEFEKMRKLIKKPMTDRAKTMLLNKLRTYPKEQWIALLEQSIEHDWQTIYKLQTDDSSNTTKQTLPKSENGLVEYPPRSGNMIAKIKALELIEEINRKIQKATSDEIEDLVVSPWTGDNITRIEYEIQRKAFDER